MAEAEDRTQAASERRLQRAREDGEVPLSREVTAAAVLGAAALFLSLAGGQAAEGMGLRLRDMLEALDAPPEVALRHAATAWLTGAGPMLGLVLMAGCLAVLLQTGFLLRTHALMPDLARLNPQRGIKRVFSLDNGMEALKAIAKLGVLAWAAWSALLAAWPQSERSLMWLPGTLVGAIAHDLTHLLLVVVACQAGIALLDAGWTRWRFAQRMRMSREDLKQEQKESDGDPRIKAKLRQLRLARARRRMLDAVARATVVITNPTHYSVALVYERGAQSAPRVVAKGVDEVAARIREAAQKASVPVMPNPPLARALYAVPLDAEVPAEHFKAVAEIIAYVWRLKGMAARR